jgi:ribonuclease T1
MAKNRRRRAPNNQRPTVSAALVLVAVAIFFLFQWNNGSLSGLFGTPRGTGATPTAMPTPTEQAVTAAQNAGTVATASPITRDDETATAVPESAQPTATLTVTPRAPPTATPELIARATRYSDLLTIAYADLPPEAHDTLRLIEQGGPFPYDRDGIVFQNREGILPDQARGYYHEYTVITPGINHRGARRIVTGEEGERYYTDDHYESFREIVQ